MPDQTSNDIDCLKQGSSQCPFCGEWKTSLSEAAKHGFFEHSPTGKWIKKRFLESKKSSD